MKKTSNKITFNKDEPTPNLGSSYGLMSEYLFQSVFGEKAYHGHASMFGNDDYFKSEVIKMLDRFEKDVSELIAPENLIDHLNYQLSYYKKELNMFSETSNNFKGILVINLKIIATLLGYHYQTGSKKSEPYFIPSVWEEMAGWNNSSDYFSAKERLVTHKKLELIRQMVAEGLTSSQIALVLNISGYRVAQIKKRIKQLGGVEHAKK